MCFSATADLIAGSAIGLMGVDALRHAQSRGEFPIAVLPVLLGGHQLIETFVWWGLQGRVAPYIGDLAMWIYLVVAFVVLPVLVPVAVLALEPEPRRRRWMTAFAALGVVVSSVLARALWAGPVTVELLDYHLAYGTGLKYGLVVVASYVVATCGSLLLSSHRTIAAFGVLNAVVVGVLATVEQEGFASLWCGWAAATSGVVVVFLRQPRPLLATTGDHRLREARGQ